MKGFDMYENVRKTNLEARKQKNVLVSETTSLIISEAKKIAIDSGDREHPTDEQVIQAISRIKKGVDETLKFVTGEAREKSEKELEILVSFLPKQLEKSDILEIIKTQNLSGIKEIMQFFTMNFKGQYDGKLLSSIAKEI